MQAPKQPPAPDPVATAKAQGASNIATATAGQTINMVDKIGPDGSEKYNNIGYVDIPDGFGGTTKVPRFSQTTTLSAPNQAIYDTNKQTEQNIATIGRDQSQRIGGLLSSPVNLNNEATEARLFELGSRRLNPQFARDEEALRTRLANSGIRQGSSAWATEMGNFDQRRNDAMNQLLLAGRGQAVQEALTERNQPINEITALMSGSQVSMPQFAAAPQQGVAGVDYAGMVRDKYNADMAAYNSRLSSRNAMMGGLFGLAGSGLQAFMLSDRRAKTDIRKVGKLDNGLNVYSYRYKGGETPQIGLMAQEVEKKNPDAVAKIGGLMAVNYDEATR